MGKIPPDFAKRMRAVATSYFDFSGRWVTRAKDTDSRLLEVWQLASRVEYHPSRNRFYYVKERTEKAALLGLLDDLNKMLVFYAGHLARQRRGKERIPRPVDPPKSLTRPSWARVENVIGYTSSRRTRFHGGRLVIGGLDSYPSIYFKQGHATIDHGARGNSGWDERADWKRLFFGNVPSNELSKSV